MRSAVRQALLSLREVLDAGIDTLGDREETASSPEKITIE